MPHYLGMSTGFLVGTGSNGKPGITGSCAAYTRRGVLVTAAHCIPVSTDSELYVVLPAVEPVLAHQVVIHPDSDIAVVFATPARPEVLQMQVFGLDNGDLIEGGDFLTFGYPTDGTGTPTGRLFKGHFLRHLGYTDSSNRSYFAGELSIPAPGGLSGGPVVRDHSSQLLTAIVTTNVESYVILDSFEEVERDGKTLRVESRRVVQYGIAAMLPGLAAWLDAALATDRMTQGHVGPPARAVLPSPADTSTG